MYFTFNLLHVVADLRVVARARVWQVEIGLGSQDEARQIFAHQGERGKKVKHSKCHLVYRCIKQIEFNETLE